MIKALFSTRALILSIVSTMHPGFALGTRRLRGFGRFKGTADDINPALP